MLSVPTEGDVTELESPRHLPPERLLERSDAELKGLCHAQN